MEMRFENLPIDLRVAQALERIADAQEKLLAIATEARNERIALSTQMKKAFQQPLEPRG